MVSKFRTLFSILWLGLSISLGGWWFYHGLDQANRGLELARQSEVDSKKAEEVWTKETNMIRSEGIFFLFILSFGGITLIYLNFQDEYRKRILEKFFSTVSHEMKTPLTRLQIQIESLIEDSQDSKVQKVLQKLIKEKTNIQSQMEKAFYVAALMRGENLFFEKTPIANIFDELRKDFPGLEIHTDPSLLTQSLNVDKKALDSILRNLLENSIKHGDAEEIMIKIKPLGNMVQIDLIDDGKGFNGDPKDLGKPYIRLSQNSGTGLGIYIVSKLTKKMNGKFQIIPAENGFHAQIQFPLDKQ
jgi:signal transduction histidine kinase